MASPAVSWGFSRRSPYGLTAHARKQRSVVGPRTTRSVVLTPAIVASFTWPMNVPERMRFTVSVVRSTARASIAASDSTISIARSWSPAAPATLGRAPATVAVPLCDASPKTSASSRRPHQRPRAPSTMSSSRAEPVPSRIPVRSLITVTYLSPRRVCVRLDDSAREYGTVGFEPLTGGFEAELVELGERGQVGIGEAVRQVGCAWWPRPASHPPPTEPSPGRARVLGRGGHAERAVRGRVHRCCRCHQ